VTLIAFGQLVFTSTARAQAPALAAQPYEGLPPPAGYPAPPPGYPTPPTGYPAAAAPTPAPTPVSPGLLTPPPGVPPVNGPVVQIRSDNPKARLQTMRLTWRDVCTAPCNVPVDPNGTYRIGGGSIRPSAEFRMPRPAGTVLVTTETGSNGRHWVGVAMIIGGLGAVLGGIILRSLASSNANYTSDQRDFYKAAGLVYIVGGAAVAAIGIPVSMSSTSVELR
jgi:hypothetical protein